MSNESYKEIQWVLDHRHCGIQIQFLVYSKDPKILCMPFEKLAI